MTSDDLLIALPTLWVPASAARAVMDLDDEPKPEDDGEEFKEVYARFGLVLLPH